MFDIGFIEVFIVAVISLLVLGPERLPRVVLKTGRYIGQVKKLMTQWSQEINRQLDNEAMRAGLEKQMSLDTVDDEIKELKTFGQKLAGKPPADECVEPLTKTASNKRENFEESTFAESA